MTLSVQNISKSIHHKMILENISLEMESGHIYGFVGRNGSGKTMLFRALSGLMKIDSGKIMLDNKVLHKDFQILPNLGIVLENVGLYPDMTGVQNLSFLASFRKCASQEDICLAIKRVGLNPDDRRTYGKYSLGMKQRLAIAQAVMEQPDVLMLDEPTNGLDEEGIDAIRKLILEEKERGAIVLLASHNKEDIRLLVDDLYRVKEGHVERQENAYENS